MHPCPACGTLARSGDHCPHCGAKVCSGLCVPRSAAAVLLGLSLAACDAGKGLGDGNLQPAYGDVGPELTDADGDGYYAEQDDCDDDDADVHPDADETPGDGIDSNCDGEDDT